MRVRRSTRVYSLVAVVGFLIALTGPAASLVLFGPPEPYEGRAFTDVPSLYAILADDGAARGRLGRAWSDRLPVRKASIAAVSAVQYDIFGFIDTPRVVSGTDGFLFFKPSLESYACAQRGYIDAQLRASGLLVSLARAADIDLFITMSPNKATVRTAELGGRAALYADCYAEMSKHVSAQLTRIGNGRFVSHFESIVASASTTGYDYFEKDTHWMEHQHASAIADVFMMLRPQVRIDSTGFPTVPGTRDDPDLSRMLLLDHDEFALRLDPEAFQRIIRQTGPVLDTGVVIHDSFYNAMRPFLRSALPNTAFFAAADVDPRSNERSAQALGAALERADFVLVNVVERNLLDQLTLGAASMYSRAGSYFLDMNRMRAGAACASATAVSIPAAVQKLQSASYAFAARVDITHLAYGEDELLCLEVVTTAASQTQFALALPARGDAPSLESSVPFSTGGGEHTIRLLLPADYLGDELRVISQQPPDQFTLEKVVVSRVSPPRNVSAAR